MAEKGMITANGEGMAGIWLAKSGLDGGREHQVSLGCYFEFVHQQAYEKALQLALDEIKKSPTLSAAQDSIEAHQLDARRAADRELEKLV